MRGIKSEAVTSSRLRRRSISLVLVLLGLLVGLLSAAPAGAATENVLILDSTVSGGMSSEEAQAAIALGYGVDVVNGATWATMTAAQFGAYRAIILGDATCVGSGGNTAPYLTPAETNRAVWSAQVDGNIIVNGTDPVYHSGQGGLAMTERGVAFAVDAAGKTGLYLSLSCYYHDTAPGTPVTVLDQFGSFTVTGVGCFNDAHIVATHPALIGMTDASLSNWSCSVHEAFDLWPTAGANSFTVLAIAEGAGTTYTAPDGSVGIPYVLARGGGIVPGDIQLSPPSETNNVGTPHTVSALVSSGGTPQAGVTVTFKVVSGPHAGVTGTGTTNASGVATFSYTGTTVGTDTIEASFVDGSVTQTSNQVTKTWTGDTTKPTCNLTKKTATGIEVTVRDTGSGLKTIQVTKAVNATVAVPPFAQGVTTPLVVKATKVNAALSSQVELRVTDVAGNVTLCDPILTTVMRESGPQVFQNVPEAESVVTITNGTPGLKRLIVRVNGTAFVQALTPGQEVTLDISSAMTPGDTNKIRLRAVGKGTADILIWDGV